MENIGDFPNPSEVLLFFGLILFLADLFLSLFIYLLCIYLVKKNISFLRLFLWGIAGTGIGFTISYFLIQWSGMHFEPGLSLEELQLRNEEMESRRFLLILIPIILGILLMVISAIGQIRKKIIPHYHN